MEKEYIRNVTFPVTAEMLIQLGQESTKRGIGISELMRQLVAESLGEINPVERS